MLTPGCGLDSGTIVLGGDCPSGLAEELRGGFYVNPTVIVDLPLDCRVLQEEIFGPVVTINAFDTEAEVIAVANSVKYGLSASLWTGNVQRAHRVARALQAGTVWVNCWMLRDLRMPFGGTKHSGVGREGADDSVDFYTEATTICMKYH